MNNSTKNTEWVDNLRYWRYAFIVHKGIHVKNGQSKIQETTRKGIQHKISKANNQWIK